MLVVREKKVCKKSEKIIIMTSLSCGVDALLRAAQYLQFLEEQETSQQSPQQLYRPLIVENQNPPISTGMYEISYFLCAPHIHHTTTTTTTKTSCFLSLLFVFKIQFFLLPFIVESYIEKRILRTNLLQKKER